jgi:hypothetical protein
MLNAMRFDTMQDPQLILTFQENVLSQSSE